MAYKKILVDNTTCLRRFHISFDSESTKKNVSLKCPYCSVEIFSSKSHPQAAIIRDEVLTNVNDMSPLREKKCNFKDANSPKD